MTKRMPRGLSALVILILALAAACGGPRQESKAAPGQQAAGEPEVAVKGAFDPQEAAASAPAEKTSAEAEEARKQFPEGWKAPRPLTPTRPRPPCEASRSAARSRPGC